MPLLEQFSYQWISIMQVLISQSTFRVINELANEFVLIAKGNYKLE